LAVRTADEQVGKLVRHLKATGRWERSVLLVVAGGCAAVSLQRHIDADSLLRGKVLVARDEVRWTGPASDRAVAMRHLESVVSRVPGPVAPVPLLATGGGLSTVDVAPTAGRLLGLPEPPGGYDGTSII
jgi:arylsulfatase A-like enzyme